MALAFGISLVLLIGLALRYQAILFESLWLDELHSSWVVQGALSDVHGRAAEGNQPPLFFWITWYLQEAMGETELSLRGTSFISSAGLIVLAASVVFFFSRSTLGAIFTASILALGDPFLYYGSEARPYGLLQFLSLLQVIFFWRSLPHLVVADRSAASPSFRRMLFDLGGFVLTSWLLIYTHYSAAIIAVPELLFGVWWLGSRRRSIYFGRVAFVVGVVVVGGLPLLNNLGLVYGRRANWSSVASVGQFWREEGMALVAWVLIPGVVWAIWSKGSLRENDRESKTGATEFAALLFCWGATTFLAIITIHVGGIAPLAMSRYYSVAIVSGPVLCGMLFSKTNSPVRRSVLFGGLLAVQIALSGFTFQWAVTSLQQGRAVRMRTETWYQAIAELNRDAKRDKYPVLLFGAVIEDADALINRDAKFQEYLQFPVRGLYQLEPKDRFVFAGPTLGHPHFSDSEIEYARSSGGAWLLIRHQDEEVNRIVFEICELLQVDPISARRFQAPESLVVLVAIDL